MRRLFIDHPATVGETYFEHLRSALSFAGPLLLAACACAIHAIFPFLFQTTGSRTVDRLRRRMIDNRMRQNPAESGEQATKSAA